MRFARFGASDASVRPSEAMVRTAVLVHAAVVDGLMMEVGATKRCAPALVEAGVMNSVTSAARLVRDTAHRRIASVSVAAEVVRCWTAGVSVAAEVAVHATVASTPGAAAVAQAAAPTCSAIASSATKSRTRPAVLGLRQVAVVAHFERAAAAAAPSCAAPAGL